MGFNVDKLGVGKAACACITSDTYACVPSIICQISCALSTIYPRWFGKELHKYGPLHFTSPWLCAMRSAGSGKVSGCFRGKSKIIAKREARIGSSPSARMLPAHSQNPMAASHLMLSLRIGVCANLPHLASPAHKSPERTDSQRITMLLGPSV